MKMGHATILFMLTLNLLHRLGLSTGVVHHDNCAWSSNGLENSQCSNGVKSPTTGISNHGGLCAPISSAQLRCQTSQTYLGLGQFLRSDKDLGVGQSKRVRPLQHQKLSS
jgi:hypothetical protein